MKRKLRTERILKRLKDINDAVELVAENCQKISSHLPSLD